MDMITIQTMPTTPTRHITAKVELYNSSTLLNTFNYNDYLKSIDINRTCEENKLFGFTISQKATVKVLDKDNAFTVAEGYGSKIYFNNEQGYISPFPTMYVSESSRNKVTNEITFTAYDLMTEATKRTVAELELGSYTIYEFAAACASLLGATGISLINIKETDSTLQLSYDQGANFDGTETIRQALTAVAEATQTIIYFDYNNNLTLKRLSIIDIVGILTLNDYFTYELKGNEYIKTIAHITELGDNIEATNNLATGITHYIRNNPFLELREDVGDILANAASLVSTNTYNLYELNARGNYLIELGDCFGVVSKNGSAALFLLNDSIKYSGGLSQKIYFNYGDKTQTAANPATLGETLKQTSAKVDKINREIELLASEESITESKVAALELTTGSISARVENVEKASDNLNGTVADLTKKVEATMTEEQVKLEIKTELANGAPKVETATGFTFNEEGLTVSKSGSEMTTTITEDGMTVYKDNSPVLNADNEGVKAIDLHATTYLIIGKNSRFEDYGNRTGCFWIGGSN